jgi:hypothetical protein
MSDDVTALHESIPGYGGHANAQGRRLSDQQVRAWTGESLVDLRDRLDVTPVSDRFEALLMRCEFGDQHVIKALENNHFAEPGAATKIEELDGRLVATATGARTVTAEGLEGFIGDLERAFDDRATAVVTNYLKR